MCAASRFTGAILSVACLLPLGCGGIDALDPLAAPTQGTDGKHYFMVALPGDLRLYREVKKDEKGRWVNDGRFKIWEESFTWSFGALKDAAGAELLTASFQNGSLVDLEITQRQHGACLRYDSLTSKFMIGGKGPSAPRPKNWFQRFNDDPHVRTLRDAIAAKPAAPTKTQEQAR